jgi:hypothetical protein
MKNLIIYLAILLFAVVGMSSCNPIDEGQLPPSNTNNMTPDQALPLLQGSWYLDRIEYITGPICAGGDNRVTDMFSTDLAFSGWKMEFTNNQVVAQVFPSMEAYEFYAGGGNSTGNFSLISGSDPMLGLLFPLVSSSNGVYFFIHYPNFTGLEDYHFQLGGKIEYLSDNELRINANSEGSDLNGGMLYFKRSNQSSLPLNSSNLSGSFVHDNTKVVQSGIVQSSSAVDYGHTLTFTNEVISDNDGHRYFKCLELYPIIPQSWYEKTFFTTSMLLSTNGVGGDYLYQDYYCTSNTNLIGSVASSSNNCSIYLISSTELILRDYFTCNDYEEYHLTKVN